jgi:cytosine/creatinine deaminase
MPACWCDASFVLLQARDTVEAIGLRANRLKAWRRGELLAEMAEVVAKLHMTGRPNPVDFLV